MRRTLPFTLTKIRPAIARKIGLFSMESESFPKSTPELETPEFQMRRRAAAVLEVLGGAKCPIEAAESLGISRRAVR